MNIVVTERDKKAAPAGGLSGIIVIFGMYLIRSLRWKNTKRCRTSMTPPNRSSRNIRRRLPHSRRLTTLSRRMKPR